MRPLRVVFVTKRFWPLVGGTEKNLAQLSVELVARQYQVTVWTACWQDQWPRNLLYRGVRVIREADAPRDRWGTFRYLRRLGCWLRHQRGALDVVCVSGLREEASTAARALAGSTPLVLRVDPSRELRPVSEPNAKTARRCSWPLRCPCRRADAVIAPFACVQRQLLAEGFPPEKVHRITPGVRIPGPRSIDARRAARRALAEAVPALQMADESLLAVYLGRLASQSGLAELITAWRRVVGQFPEARLWLVGQGILERWLEDQIEQHGLAGRVVRAGTFDQVDDILAAADWLVEPLPGGGLGLAILEAIAAGLPVIATDTPEHRELLAQGTCGLLVPPASAEGLAEAMLRLAADPVLRDRLGACGRRRVLEAFSIQRQADDYSALFSRLIALDEH